MRAQCCYFCRPTDFDLSEVASELENIYLVDFGTFWKAVERVPAGYREACHDEVHRRLLSRVPAFPVARKMYRLDLVTGATRSLLLDLRELPSRIETLKACTSELRAIRSLRRLPSDMILYISPFLASSSLITDICRILERGYNLVYLPVLGEAFESEMRNDKHFNLLWDNYFLVRIHHEQVMHRLKMSLSKHVKILQDISWWSQANVMAYLLDLLRDV